MSAIYFSGLECTKATSSVNRNTILVSSNRSSMFPLGWAKATLANIRATKKIQSGLIKQFIVVFFIECQRECFKKLSLTLLLLIYENSA
jgi:hypothetical protein